MRIHTWSVSSVILFVGAFFVCAGDPAYAYIDPGTGSYLLQFAIGALFALLFAVKAFWGRIRESLSRAFRRTQGRGNE
jgi:drug/metabolite transporter (DMT)-like permease